jgi:hypothetical protein
MYIHIGNERTVRTGDIIGIFDIETTVSAETREYIAAAGKRKNAVYVSYDMPKCFICAVEDGKEKVYVTNISSRTVIKRSNS